LKFRISILIFFVIFICDISAQLRPRFSSGFDVKIPRIISNNGFNKAMFGIADLDLNCNYLATNYLSIGLDYKYAYYQINNKFIQNQTAGQLELHFIGLAVFYINNMSDITYAKFGVKVGTGQLLGSLGTNTPNYTENNFLIEPTIGYYLNNSSFGSVGLVLTYSFWNSGFKPEVIGMSQISGLSPKDFSPNNNVFCIGLSYEKLFGYK
jgi:hypothetical protein